jgi:hypothetical protein
MITLSLGFRIRNQPVIRWENQMSQNQVGISKSKIWFDLICLREEYKIKMKWKD